MVENEKSVLISVYDRVTGLEKAEEYLGELKMLAHTAGSFPVRSFFQKMDVQNPKTFIGSGKLEEIALFVKEHKISLAVFDDELSGSQLKNIEKILKCRVLDRTHLILDIFAIRARTSYAKTQVELAQYQYLLPRLTRMWTHLERQKGGIGMRGPGETEIETDRRRIRQRIALLKKKLEQIDRQQSIQRRNRSSIFRVSLVGYTNAGKSTLMNALSGAEVFAEDKLFATLDTTVRKLSIRQRPFLIADTVGFIRKLPTQLVESFKSTLVEIQESDLILHLVDVSHPGFTEHIEVVEKTLAELGCGDKKTLYVFNKTDAFSQPKIANGLTRSFQTQWEFREWRKEWNQTHEKSTVFISAQERKNIDVLKGKIYSSLNKSV